MVLDTKLQELVQTLATHPEGQQAEDQAEDWEALHRRQPQEEEPYQNMILLGGPVPVPDREGNLTRDEKGSIQTIPGNQWEKLGISAKDAQHLQTLYTRHPNANYRSIDHFWNTISEAIIKKSRFTEKSDKNFPTLIGKSDYVDHPEVQGQLRAAEATLKLIEQKCYDIYYRKSAEALQASLQVSADLEHEYNKESGSQDEEKFLQSLLPAGVTPEVFNEKVDTVRKKLENSRSITVIPGANGRASTIELHTAKPQQVHMVAVLAIRELGQGPLVVSGGSAKHRRLLTEALLKRGCILTLKEPPKWYEFELKGLHKLTQHQKDTLQNLQEPISRDIELQERAPNPAAPEKTPQGHVPWKLNAVMTKQYDDLIKEKDYDRAALLIQHASPAQLQALLHHLNDNQEEKEDDPTQQYVLLLKLAARHTESFPVSVRKYYRSIQNKEMRNPEKESIRKVLNVICQHIKKNSEQPLPEKPKTPDSGLTETLGEISKKFKTVHQKYVGTVFKEHGEDPSASSAKLIQELLDKRIETLSSSNSKNLENEDQSDNSLGPR